MEAQNGHFSVSSSSWKFFWSKFFSCYHQKIFMIFLPQPMKISSESKNLLLHKILWRFRQIGKWKISQLINKKLVIWIFVTNRFERYYKVYYWIRKNVLALRAREAAKWPRTFYMVLTVHFIRFRLRSFKMALIYSKQSLKSVHRMGGSTERDYDQGGPVASLDRIPRKGSPKAARDEKTDSGSQRLRQVSRGRERPHPKSQGADQVGNQ